MINLNSKISDNFTWKEFTVGHTVGKLDYANLLKMLEKYSGNIEKLVTGVLQPVANRFGTVHINSGLRTLLHNAEIGGKQNSQHLKGLAADFRVNDLDAAFNYIKNCCDFDQLIRYKNFIHVSYLEGHQRKQVLFDKSYSEK